MKNNILMLLGVLSLWNFSSRAADKKLIIDNPAERGVYIARSTETADEIITEGYWHVLQKEKDSFDMPSEGKLTVRLNFDNDREPINPPGVERCGSPTDKFMSIVKKVGEPKVTLYMGEGSLEGYATKKEGKDCKEVGGEMLKGFHETVLCEPGLSGIVCLPFTIVDTLSSHSMYVGACNETELASVYVAVKFFEANEWRSQGWWEVKKDTCRKVGPFPSDKPVYAVAMNGSSEPVQREWVPKDSSTIAGCINPTEGFVYAEGPSGSCEARETIPASAPAPEKANFGKLAEAGFHGVAVFNILP